MILHADLDAFFASVEQARDPRLRGRPVVVGGKRGEASVIASCSYEARRFGLHAGMPLREAESLCPHAAFLTGSYPEYQRVSDTVFSFLRDLSPAVEVVSLDEAYVDLEGAEHLHGGAWRAARALRRRVHGATGLALTVGLGPSRVFARLATACAKPDGIALLDPARARDLLERLPLTVLPGVGRKTADLLARLNLARVGDLARLPEELLVETVGARGRALHRLARGEDPRPLETDRRPKSVSRQSALHRESADPALLDGYLFYLCERAARELRRLGARARTVTVRFSYADHKTREGSATLREPADLDRELHAAAHALFGKLHDRRVRLRRVGVEAAGLVWGGARQEALFDAARAQRLVRLTRAVDTIRARHGFHRVVQGPSVALLKELPQTPHGFLLRTASLTR
ncbi:MAG: DNA polymerase IV [Planctomycetaceae bacterium]